MLTGKLPVGCLLHGKLPHVVIIPLLECKWKDPADVNNYKPITIATLIKVLEQVLLSRLAMQVYATVNLVSSKHMGQKWPYLHTSKQWIFYGTQDTPVYISFLDIKNEFGRVNHCMDTGRETVRQKYAKLHIVKLFIFWYREQEFMVRRGNSLSMTFRCSNGIRQGGQLSQLLHNCTEMTLTLTSVQPV